MGNIALLTPRLSFDSKRKEYSESYDPAWVKFFESNPGWEICYISCFSNDKITLKSISNCKLVILSGGNNLYSVDERFENKIRDDFETKLIKECIIQSKNILGVCRGAQIINKYFGGELSEKEGHALETHSIDWTESLYGFEESILKVRSYHNYVITKLAPDLVAKAYANDDTVEAYTHQRHKILGLMWHPEREDNPQVYQSYLKDIMGA